MASSKTDFAHPAVKTVGCFLLVPAFPAVLIASFAGAQLTWSVLPASAIVSLAGLGGLLGRPNTIIQALHAVCSIYKRKCPP